MRTLKYSMIAAIGIALILVMSANWTVVDLHLLPSAFAPGLPMLPGVPLTLIIVTAFFGGLVIGMLMELIRESKHRRRLDQKRREVADLRDENTRLTRRLSQLGDDVTALGS
ncbi:MAG: LapA family protein [Pseudomonadota bacterium]